jgi:hypothetical protein
VIWFFGAVNPQRRNNFFLTQTFRSVEKSQVTTPFYAGKLTYAMTQNHTITFSTLGDFTKQTGFGYLGGIYWGRREYRRAADALETYLKLAPQAPDAERIRSTIKELRSKQ